MLKTADPYQVASRVGTELTEEIIDQTTRWAIQHRRLKAQEQEKFKERLRGGIEQSQDKIDADQYRRTRSVGAPVNTGELGAMVGGNLAVGGVLTALQNRNDKAKNVAAGIPHTPTSMNPAAILGRAFGPASMIPTGAIEAARIALNPLSDPLYRKGTRSYLSSVGEGFKGQVDQLGERQIETRGKYGLAGVPVQAFHGILNPISSLAYAGRSAKDLVLGKEGSLAERAKSAISKALGVSVAV